MVIVLIGIALPIMVRQSISTSQTIHAITSRHVAMIDLLRIEALIQRNIDKVTSQRLVLGVRTHPEGRITLSNGTSIELSGELSPLSTSSALTTMELDLNRLLVVRENTYQAPSISKVKACSAFNRGAQDLALSVAQRFAGFSLESNSEFLLLSSESTGESGCRSLTLIREDSISLASSDLGLTLRTLIPISEHATIYLSEQHSLRRLSHIGQNIAGNQPVADGIESFNCSLTHQTNFEIPIIKCSFTDSGGQMREIKRAVQLLPTQSLNLQLNSQLAESGVPIAYE